MNNAALDVLKQRRAIRSYKPEQISDEELNAVLEAGTYAPTGKGSQCPVIIAVQDPEMRDRVAKLNAKVMGTNSDPYYGAPTIVLVLFGDRAYDEEIGILDCAAVTTNMLNAAYACGLGSCWINRPKQMFAMEEGKELLREWGLPDNLRGVASIALGYADCELPTPPARKEDYITVI